MASLGKFLHLLLIIVSSEIFLINVYSYTSSNSLSVRHRRTPSRCSWITSNSVSSATRPFHDRQNAVPYFGCIPPSSSTLTRLSLSSRRGRNNNNIRPKVQEDIGVGIDLGTTNSAIAILIDGVPTIVPISEQGTRTLPSVVSYTRQLETDEHLTPATTFTMENDDGGFHVLVGRPAIEQEAAMTAAADAWSNSVLDNNPFTTTFRHVKRIMGMGTKRAQQVATAIVPHLYLPTPSLSSDTSNVSDNDGTRLAKTKKGKKYRRGGSSNNNKKVKVADSLAKQLLDAEENPAKLSLSMTTSSSTSASTSSSTPVSTLLPEQVSARIVETLLSAVTNTYPHYRITRAVVGVPAYFDDAQRQATIRAVQLAGIQKVKLLREPEAAALAYGIVHRQHDNHDDDENNNEDDMEEMVLVFDLGGGTFDVSILLVGGGICEVLATSGNTQLGGTDFDAQLVQSWLRPLLQQVQAGPQAQRMQHDDYNDDDKDEKVAKQETSNMQLSTEQLLTTAEAVRIHLSNHRVAHLALPVSMSGWKDLYPPTRVIVPPAEYQEQVSQLNQTIATSNLRASSSTSTSKQQKQQSAATLSLFTNGTHVYTELSRSAMERYCNDQFLSLLRPLREVAILAGALLPGDTRPGIVQAVLDEESDDEDADDDEEEVSNMDSFPNFYDEDNENGQGPTANDKLDSNDDPDKILRQQLQSFAAEMEMKEQKKAQQRGRQKARDVAKGDRKFRMEKKGAATNSGGSAPPVLDVKVRDGIVGRPIAQVILVGGATRMPAVGRLLTAMTGVVPQRTVNPDEAVALGCAVQVGVLDGVSDLTVLSPMQAAILRAFAEQKQKEQGMTRNAEVKVPRDDDDEDEDLLSYDYV